ncbi:NitT/TauT family transport system substrate-binding protein [Acetitomaculum ruminis DSM 5522]|uniref:Thiamine pyrimidine synthase n=1 Tax=Acetitomaculum ruminis DSM 5522 TaxID=1120918 RepID=A0A1I0ZM46_9FIRM|nr:ABC transporter substrate-binding protein [Acetitomaculum ruminis]SFB26557.1 NitT/TauT family transport system substrate-binding protein [Acetitomaculum ruminis DSM 5522]
MKKRMKRILCMLLTASLAVGAFVGCGESQKETTSTAENEKKEELTSKDIIEKAAKDGKVGNWGLGNEYEVLALLAKYDLPTDFLSQDFTMDGFDDDSITLASAMTYNELGLVKNDYEGGYGYKDTVEYIDMNDEGVAMLEDNIFCSKDFAKENPETVAAFLYASFKGWEYAVENPKEAAQICYEYGSSVSKEHQEYMADEVAKLVSTDTKGEKVSDIGNMDEDAMKQTLDIAKKYVSLDDADANEKFQNLTLDDIRDTSFYEKAQASDGKFNVEKKKVSIQLKWLPDAQFMGYYVALDKGYYKEVGFEDVNIVSGGGDIAETTAVNNNTVDFGVTWETNLASADASGMNLVEIAQIFQRSGLVLVYKPENY